MTVMMMMISVRTIVFLVVCVALVACTASDDASVKELEQTLEALTSETPSPSALRTATPSSPPTAAPTSSPQPSALGISRTSPVPVGTPLILVEGWEMTVVGPANPDAWPAILAANEFNDPPAPGMRFVLVRIRGKNVSADDPDMFYPEFSTKLVGSSGIGFDGGGCGVLPDDFSQLNTELFKGGVVEGNACYEVPVPETGLVLYTTFAADRNRRWFAIQ